jgi:hypothetical protein
MHHEWSLNGQLSNLYPVTQNSIQDVTSFRGEDFKTFFPMRSYVKTTVYPLKIDHLRTIHAMFALKWLTGFREEDF